MRIRSLVAVCATVTLITTGGVIAPAYGATPGRPETVKPAVVATAAPQATGLTTNDLTDPLGVGSTTPRLSWQLQDATRGSTQTAYRIRASNSIDQLAAAPTWDSGQVASAQSLDVPWGGAALTSSTRYYWQVQLTDNSGATSDWSTPAWFETGLLNTTDWDGSNWVGSAGTNSWSDYTLTSDFTINNSDKSAVGFIFRATDTSNEYMWQINYNEDQPGYALRPHTKVNGGYAVISGQTKDIGAVINGHGGPTAQHTITITVAGNLITTSIDGESVSSFTNGDHPTGGVGLRTNGIENATIKDMTVVAADGSTLFNPDLTKENPFTGGTTSATGLQISGDNEVWQSVAPPIVRGTFTTDTSKTIASARAYASAQGLYQLNLNGAQVGDEYLAPGWTDYNTTYQYQTYDITSQVKAGDNALGVQLADGWFAGNLLTGRNFWGSDLSVIAQVRVTYTDGTSSTFGSDSSWKASTGAVRSADLYNGESYDASKEQKGWDTTPFDDSSWSPVVTRASQTAKLKPQTDQPVRITGERPALTQKEPSPKAFVYDLGQNMVGTAKLTLTGKAGQQVRIRYAEVENPDGTIYTANLRSAKATDYYTFAADGTITFHPTLTQHGFRYVEVTGLDTAPALADVTGMVWGSAGGKTMDLSTSDALVNQIQSNITWGQRGNFVSIPTDTPARDERLGWTGDISEFASTATYNLDSEAFLSKWIGDLRTDQLSSGAYTDVAPSFSGFGSGNAGWADAGITVPYAVWQSYDNTAVIASGWSSMTKYMDYLASTSNNFQRDGGAYKDWLNLNDDTASNIIGTAFYAHSADLMSQMAAAIGNTDDATKYRTLYNNIRASYQASFIDAFGNLASNTQTGYAISISFGLAPDAVRTAMATNFVATLQRANWHLSTGFLGLKDLLPALTDIGRSDVAYRVLLNKDYPSWGYEISKGATTVWERWDSIGQNGQFGDVGMNSFNHYAYGSVGAWMYDTIGGISALEPGYRKSLIAPVPGGDLTHSSMDYQTPYGTVSSHWTVAAGSYHLNVSVPANTTARVVVPAVNPLAVTEGGQPLSKADGVVSDSDTGDTVTIEIGSGDYAFAVESPAADLASVKDGLAALGAKVTAANLTDAQRAALVADLGTANDDVDAALADPTVVATKAAAALAALKDASSLIAADLAAGPLDQAGSDALTGLLTPMLDSLGKAVAAALGLSVTTTAPTGEVLPGQTVNLSVTAVNGSTSDIADMGASLDLPAGWSATPASAAHVAVAAGQTATFAFAVSVPADATVGSNALVGRVEVPSQSGRVSIPASTTVTVGTPVTLTAAATPASAVPGGYARVKVALHNRSTTAVTGSVSLAVPTGWAVPDPSAPVTVAAGADATVTVVLLAPVTGTAGPISGITASFASSTQTLAQAAVPFTLTIGEPVATQVVDYLDMGNTGSAAADEPAHAVTFSSRSGNSPDEAGYTRRYTFKGTTDGFIQFTMKITKGQPFVLRARETYDGPQIKQYTVKVNGVLVNSRMFTHTGGVGTEMYQVLVDDPTLLTGDTVTVRFDNNPQGLNYDPSIADVWTLPAPGADTTAPAVTLTTDPAAPNGTNGWYTSPVTLTASATDDGDQFPVISAAVDGAEAAQVSAPITFTTDGIHTASVTAADAVGNVSAPTAWTAKVDATPPVSSGSVDPVTRQATFTAADNTSGVARIEYQLPGGGWLTATGPVTVGAAAVVISYRAVDQAGNVEATHQVSMPKAGVTLLTSTTLAVLSSGSVGAGGSVTLTVKVSGSGAVPTGAVRVTSRGVQVGQGVLSGGRVVLTIKASALLPGSYRLLVGYSGNAVYAASSDTVDLSVVKATSSTSLRVTPSTVVYGNSPKAVVVVQVPGLTATGIVTLSDGRRVIARGRLAKNAVTITLPATLSVGTHTLTASYSGDRSVKPSSGTAKLVVVKATAKVKAPARTVRASAKAVVGVTVSTNSKSIAAAGVVIVKAMAGRRLVATGAARLSGGRASVTLPKLSVGKYTLTVSYAGSTVVSAASVKTGLTVTK
ncbi:Ig-like domain (group 3) [Nakamurella panacisegetis]|uniref:alpha-L-rhamnosidase n=1 Tax=Nakamurella panacisegetis TaxID=1090615 RepID=A0A1H0N3J8_9ACTN|nr:family 78 glycoside hydrolase catalytic domain [Nakamurella panacisegetis]SDO87085.1 Ig-like domain (group 3) [Nakamurella panacisegetis]